MVAISTSAPETYLEEGELDDVRNKIAHIADELVGGRVGFLFGSGMSAESNGLLGRDLGFNILKHAFARSAPDPLPDEIQKKIEAVLCKYPLEAIAEAATKELPTGFNGLREFIAQKIVPHDAKPHDGHLALISLAQAYNIQRIYTTNFDNLISNAFSAGGKTITESNLREMNEAIQQGKTVIVHLHGTLQEKPLICECDLVSSTGPLFQLFLADLMCEVFIFVGYSLSDPNLRALYFYAKDILENAKSCIRLPTWFRRLLTGLNVRLPHEFGKTVVPSLFLSMPKSSWSS